MASVKPTFALTEDSTQVLVEVKFPGCVSAAYLECDVLKTALMITDTQGHYTPLTIELPPLLRKGGSWADCSYKAKFSKKQHTLTLVLSKPVETAATVSSAGGTICKSSSGGSSASDTPSPSNTPHPATAAAAAVSAATPPAAATAAPEALSLQEQAMQAALSDLQAQWNASVAPDRDAASTPEKSDAGESCGKEVALKAESAGNFTAKEVGAALEEVEYVWTMPPYASVRTMRPSAAHEHLFEVATNSLGTQGLQRFSDATLDFGSSPSDPATAIELARCCAEAVTVATTIQPSSSSSSSTESQDSDSANTEGERISDAAPEAKVSNSQLANRMESGMESAESLAELLATNFLKAPPARLAFENTFREAMAPYATAQHQAALAATAAANAREEGGEGIGAGNIGSNGAVLGNEESAAAARVLEYVCAHGHLPPDDEDEDEEIDGEVEVDEKAGVGSASSGSKSSSSSSRGSRNWASTCAKRAPLATVIDDFLPRAEFQKLATFVASNPRCQVEDSAALGAGFQGTRGFVARFNAQGLKEDVRTHPDTAPLSAFVDSVRDLSCNAFVLNVLLCAPKPLPTTSQTTPPTVPSTSDTSALAAASVGWHRDATLGLQPWAASAGISPQLAHQVNVLYVNVPKNMRGGKLLLRHARRDRAAVEAAAATAVVTATGDDGGERVDDGGDDAEYGAEDDDDDEDYGDEDEYGGDGINTTSSRDSSSSRRRVAVDLAVLPRPNRSVAFRGDAEHCVQAYTTGSRSPNSSPSSAPLSISSSCRVSVVLEQYKVPPGSYDATLRFEIVKPEEYLRAYS